MKLIGDPETDSPYTHTPEEVRDIVISVLVLSFAFTVALFGKSDPYSFVFQIGFIGYLIPTAIIVAFSIVVREIAQKGMARSVEAFVSYEIWAPGAIISLLTSFFGFVFAAVGGTRVATEYAERHARWRVELNPQHAAIVAVIGPLLSLSLAMGLVMLSPIAPGLGLGENIFLVGAEINTFLALFTMLPINPLDGAKIFRWSATIFFFIIAMSLAVLALLQGWI